MSALRLLSVALAACVALSAVAYAKKKPPVQLKTGDAAPLFTLPDDHGGSFSLESRRGQWTVLYFYPKSGTPGCTRQACAFRDAVEGIRALGAEVYGVSKDTVKDQESFKTKHRLNFPLLADERGAVIAAYGTTGILGMSKRWTFLVDPALKVRWIEKDVDPALDAGRVEAELKRLQSKKPE